MGIRKSILLIALITAFLAAGVLYMITSALILRDYRALENEEIQRNLVRIEDTLKKDIEYLENTSADWAYWSDTYDYIQTQNPDYAESNLSVSSLVYLDLDMLLMVDSALLPVFHLAIHPFTRQEIPLPEDILRMIEAGSARPDPNVPDSVSSGIVMTSQGPLLVSARYILQSDMSGPPQGILLFGSYLNEFSIQELSGAAQVSAKLLPITYQPLPDDFKTALTSLQATASGSYVQILREDSTSLPDRVAAYSILNDVNEKPALILRVDDERRTFHQGQSTVRLFGGLLAISGLLIGAAIYYTLDRFLNKRLLAVHQGVSRIRQTRDFSLRVPVDGEDEVSSLGFEINTMVEELNQYQAELTKSDRQFREILQNLQLVSVILDNSGSITFCNDFFLQLTGWERGDVIGKNWFSLFVSSELKDDYWDMFDSVMRDPSAPTHHETYLITRLGEKRLIAWNNSKLSDAEGRIIGVARIGEDITERRNAEEKLRLSLEETRLHLGRLTALRQIDSAITSDAHVQEKMMSILTTVQESLKVDAVGILLAESNHSAVTLAATQGSFLEKYKFESIEGLDELLHRLNNMPHALVFTDLSHASRPRWLHQRLNGNTSYNLYAVAPLTASGNLIGALEVFAKNPGRPDSEWVAHFQTLALQTAIALDSADMIARIESAKNELAVAYEATLIGWAKALELRDKDTKGHSERMMELAELLGRRLGMDETSLRDLKRGTLLHDIGKMGVPDYILHKPGPLNEDEWAVMRKHPQFANDLLRNIPYLAGALEVPYCHHERWDGSGYPRGLVGEDIPLSARIFSVMDVWDALIHTRPYRPAWAPEKALEYIQEQAGIQFDPRVVTEFVTLLVEEQPLARAICAD